MTMALVLVTQVYRSIQNYQVNKQQFINDVQTALDLGVETYYANRARKDIRIFSSDEDDSVVTTPHAGFSYQTGLVRMDSIIELTTITNVDSGHLARTFGYNYTWSSRDSADTHVFVSDTSIAISPNAIKHIRLDSIIQIRSDDSVGSKQLDQQVFSRFAQKIMISLTEEQPDNAELSQHVATELMRKKLTIGFDLNYNSSGKSLAVPTGSYPLTTTSKSTYLPTGSQLTMHFENASLVILRNGIGDLFISLLIIVTVMSVLVYLYRIIVNQKQLALIKDDLISNITHELKTPIATISSAIEGIANFNETNDRDKTLRYLNISNDQLKKLNLMVEKILETATIDSGELQINLEETELVGLTERVIKSHQMLVGEKQIKWVVKPETMWHQVDPFHIENALSNLIDNAIKYGGDEIGIKLFEKNGRPNWHVIDNGGHIDKSQKELVFEKLYRIPKGNRHDVKGFGIGLYYTRAIIEKHGGQVTLDVKPGHTCFKIEL